MFPQLKNKFPEMNSEISWKLSQFPELEEGHSARVSMPAKNVQNLHNINALFKRIFCSLGVGPSTKQIEISLCDRAKRIIAFSNQESYFSTHLHIFFIFLNFLKIPGII